MKYLKIYKEADRNISKILAEYMDVPKWTATRRKEVLSRIRKSEAEIDKKYTEAALRDYEGLGNAEATYLLKMLSDLGIPDELITVLSSKQTWGYRDKLPLITNNKQYDIVPYIGAFAEIRWSLLEPTLLAAFTAGLSIPDMNNVLFGTKALKYKDAALNPFRNSLKARTTTAANHMSNVGIYAASESNSNLIYGYIWRAILDDRTCLICWKYDNKIRLNIPIKGLKTTLPDGVYPQVHTHCRCQLVPLVKNSQYIRNSSSIPTNVKQAMDGELPDSLSYTEFFEKQPKAVQKRILGDYRYEQYTQGKLTVSEFTHSNYIIPIAILDQILNPDSEDEESN